MISDKLFFFIQALLKYFPFRLGIYLRRFLYKPFFKNFGKKIVIYDDVLIKYPSQIELGDYITINQQCYIVGKGGLKLGNYVMLGSGVKIVTTTHSIDDNSIPMAKQPIITKKIEINSDIWLGFNAIILQGTILGEGIVVAAGSVVKEGNYEKNSIIAGVPGKVIKKRNS